MRIGALFSIAALAGACGGSPVPNRPDGASDDLETRIIDGHAHLAVPLDAVAADFDAAAREAIAAMDELDITYTILAPTPFAPDRPDKYDGRELAAVATTYPNRLGFIAGGGTLNPLIHRAVAGDVVTAAEVVDAAMDVLATGAIGFGEIAAEHIVIGGTEPYLHAPPNHPLILELADVAASAGVPIDLHMEAVPENTDIPPQFDEPPNPETLMANIALFEELLDYNDEAVFIWSHAGWDVIGERSAQLCADLLRRHSNLYMGIKITGGPKANAMLEDGELDDEWRAVFEEFGDRFVLGSDQFHQAPGLDRMLPDGAATTVALIDALPQHLAVMLRYENARQLYGLAD
jgi:predicted TIM-barrel fold metal-dependent hydrolase